MDFGGEELLPIQWSIMHRGEANLGERTMLGALLIDAVECFQCRGTFSRHNDTKLRTRKRMREEAGSWFFGDGPVDAGFTFAQVCDALEIDIDDFRQQLRYWDAANLAIDFARTYRGCDFQRIGPKRGRVPAFA